MKYSMFIGRWQPLHKGHQWLINQRLSKGKNVLICIRDVEADDKNPLALKKFWKMYQNTILKKFLKKELR